ncbi:MAG: imidazole glycerol phosphate synthase, glutamine amidotransferase subunit [Spirochaetes bacterium GWD1_27_9]|nr:MAG: imidazole glycerol phosphate synthase, glutamine amidotransferase subunit [Spirochaetes bacterium GWC1_27_15]OHD30444.1 MAG: imidazole glycerol phosphate synthase, glutamine amidotransferase subunit [Spirochaetes bacterium GWD1_27_9]
MVGVINYKAGNAQSVISALKAINVSCKLVDTIDELKTLSHIILPGVGSAQATMDSLKELGLIETLTSLVLKDHVPFLGICIGLQILFDFSDEGGVKCLGWLPGRVVRFNDKDVRVPQIGWNAVKQTKSHPLFEGVNNNTEFYFVNSYYVVLENQDNLLGETEYGKIFPSIIGHENIMATQFHAEKSGSFGLKLLSNFCKGEFYVN